MMRMKKRVVRRAGARGLVWSGIGFVRICVILMVCRGFNAVVGSNGQDGIDGKEVVSPNEFPGIREDPR